MARRKETVTIDQPAQEAVAAVMGADGKVAVPAKAARNEGRDHGKVFVITEMPADQAERWAIRALLALSKAGVTVSDAAQGMAGLAAAGLSALGSLPYEAVGPLMDEMFGCVKYQHQPGQPLQDIDAGDRSQIEEVGTRLELRKRIFKLHTGF